jgi:phospholipid/cholesterol/gamma-HCH transport system substrate-binding protein
VCSSDLTGLLRDDNVKVAGVTVGKVTGVRIEKGRAHVRFTVDDDVRVPSDSQAAIRWRNLLGQRYVYVYPGEASTVLGDGDRIGRTKSVVDLGELFNRLGPIVEAIDPQPVNTFLDAVVGALDGNQAQVRQTIDDLAALMSTLATRDDAISRMIANLDTVAGTITERDQQLRALLDNLVSISGAFSDNTAVLDRAVTTLTDFSDNLAFVLGRNRSQIDSIIANLRTLSDEVGRRLPTLDSTLGGLDEAATRLFNASRWGEWLNQTIPCGGFFYQADGTPVDGDPTEPCDTSGHQGAPTPAVPATSGAQAVTELLGAGLR